MKLFPAKCRERATLRNLWRQTGNSSLLPAKCWPLLHVICQQRDYLFSTGLTHLLCYITNHLMTGPLGSSEFCFPRNSMFPSTSSRETLRFSGNKIHCSPRDQSLSVYYRRHTFLVSRAQHRAYSFPRFSGGGYKFSRTFIAPVAGTFLLRVLIGYDSIVSATIAYQIHVITVKCTCLSEVPIQSTPVSPPPMMMTSSPVASREGKL